MEEVEELPQVSLAAHQALLAARERELRRAWSRQRAYDFAQDAMWHLSHASNLVERVFYPAEAEPWREGITFQERRVAEMVDSQLKDVIGLLNKLLGSLAQSEQEVFDASTERAWQEVCSGESPELRDSRAERECPPESYSVTSERECPPRVPSAPWMKQPIYRNCIHLSPQGDSVAVSAASEKDRLSQSASDSALVQTCENQNSKEVTIMPTPSPSWAMSPLPSGTGQFFSQSRSQSFQNGNNLLQSNFL